MYNGSLDKYGQALAEVGVQLCVPVGLGASVAPIAQDVSLLKLCVLGHLFLAFRL